MATVEDGHPADSVRESPGDRRRLGRRAAGAVALVGVLLAGASLLRDYFGFEWHSSTPTPATTSTEPVRASAPVAPSSAPAGSTPSSPGGIHLDTLAVEGGGGNLVALPRALRGQPGYDRPLTISCPRNTAADKHRDVVYPLRRRYFDLTTSIRPYSPDDPQAKAYVSVIVSVEQSDGTVNRLDRGGREARQNAPGSLSASVEGADSLTLRVQCESPTGFVVLNDARLTSE